MKKTNNKGFSLVELIIVVAIMAILIGVLAPQYMKYVEKSRVSADKDILSSLHNAMSIAMSDPSVDTSAITGLNAGQGTAFATAAVTGGTPASGYSVCFWDEVLDTMNITGGASALEAQLKSKIATNNSKAIMFEVDALGNFTVYVGQKNGPEDYKQNNAGITVGATAGASGTTTTTPTT